LHNILKEIHLFENPSVMVTINGVGNGQWKNLRPAKKAPEEKFPVVFS
jgi:hypothetical protein